ncbi:probable LRR receptor-like serine/threonine-protein kinase At1g56130 [Argentina anserina]|uniref:probable LRR receptor-like serine/threonine-protein kinase At1g56130 n=1 Tax=Argentina anserina TaxID=57926 RepID=UPI00217656BF|nr:probable LRR receptor-like serine/threonine-protein kinase At1g56130 [Potentilla anserina]
MKMKQIAAFTFARICDASFYLIFCFLGRFWFYSSTAQNATTDPTEVAALNSMLLQWDAPAGTLWNISGEPCSGLALDSSQFEANGLNNPAIICDCSFNSSTVCHITHLRVYALDKTGVLLEELVALKYLTFFKIDQNFFTGSLPAWIGNMSELNMLSIAHNAFFGPIPKELGNLKKLNLLSFGINNFSGTLPPELGNLENLEELYINSCGLGGEIPKTFANLEKMRILGASDSPFSGKIPDFIGNWTKLTSLRFQGNSFEGPIPSSFSQLTSMNSLRISDIYNVSSSLDFIRNLKNLTDLSLRNALVTGRIPSDIREYQSLNILDLGFNNISGQLPSDLFNMSLLTSLFLGNNSLSGVLPSQKSDILQTIDLSYNYLSGSLPPWVTTISQLNLVVNNFTFNESSETALPGLNCLQRNFPCNRNPPRYANFSIKCGGPDMRGSDGILYEADNSTLGPATYNVTSTEKWAVSNVGLFAEKKNPSYLLTTLDQVTGSDVTPELFQTSRLSPGSLRYYGLGLENGPYTVKLQFAEMVFDDRASETWKSLGRRVFDIYIQGHLEVKDFDISKEAGGVLRVVVRNFNVNVSENYIEIHLFWAGKGTCCIPNQGDYGPLIAAVNAIPDFEPSVSGIPPITRGKKRMTGVIVGVAASVGVVSVLLIFVVLYMRRKIPDRDDDEELQGLDPRPNTFSYSELKAATGDFNLSNKLGEGGYGAVYKGILSEARLVAVKQLSVASHQGKSQFAAEIAAISAVQHRNLVKLYGCCIEGNQRIVVYEYLENKSLDQALFGNDLHLDWLTRFNILLGTARGLAYLHEESRPRIVHRDVKASNILLDAELCPKISDFGLAKLFDDKKTHISTRVAGTIGYLAPEYAMRGHLTEKADVFGFGVVIFETLSGRPNTDNYLDAGEIYLLDWAWTLHEKNCGLGLMDPRLTEFDEDEANRLIRVALLCTQASPLVRPSMSRVVGMLAGDIEVGTVTSKPSYLTDWDFEDVTGSFLIDGETPSTDDITLPKNQPTGSTTSPSTGVDLIQSPVNPNHPLLTGMAGEGR